MYKLTNVGVRRQHDGLNIPADENNRDWQEYLRWFEDGNTPLAADDPPAPLDLSDPDNHEKAIKALALVVAAWNGKTVPQLKAAFKSAWDSLP